MVFVLQNKIHLLFLPSFLRLTSWLYIKNMSCASRHWKTCLENSLLNPRYWKWALLTCSNCNLLIKQSNFFYLLCQTAVWLLQFPKSQNLFVFLLPLLGEGFIPKFKSYSLDQWGRFYLGWNCIIQRHKHDCEHSPLQVVLKFIFI